MTSADWLYATHAARERAERKAANAKRRAIRYRVGLDGTIEQSQTVAPMADGWAKTPKRAREMAARLLPPPQSVQLPVIVLPAPPRYRRDRPRCGAKTRKGTPCQAQGLGRGGRCKNHGGMSTGPRTPEGRERAHAALRAWHERKHLRSAEPGARHAEKARVSHIMECGKAGVMHNTSFRKSAHVQRDCETFGVAPGNEA